MGEVNERIITCIVCPNGCSLTATITDDGISVTGNKCPRGIKFAQSEINDPKRTIASTMATTFAKAPVVPVRTSDEIPKDKIFDVMQEINKVVISTPVKRGDKAIENVLGLGVDIIVTSDLLSKL